MSPSPPAHQEKTPSAVLPGSGLRTRKAFQAAEVPVSPGAGTVGQHVKTDFDASEDLVPEQAVQDEAAAAGQDAGADGSAAAAPGRRARARPGRQALHGQRLQHVLLRFLQRQPVRLPDNAELRHDEHEPGVPSAHAAVRVRAAPPGYPGLVTPGRPGSQPSRRHALVVRSTRTQRTVVPHGFGFAAMDRLFSFIQHVNNSR